MRVVREKREQSTPDATTTKKNSKGIMDIE